MSACRAFRDLLSAQLDGVLDPAAAAALAAHLQQCPACREAQAGLRATVDRIRALEPVEPPPWLEARILARIAAEPRRRRILPLALRPQMQAAALVLVCLTGLVVARLAGPRKSIALPAPPAPPAAVQEEAAPARPAAPAPRREQRLAPEPAPAPPPEAPAPPAAGAAAADAARKEQAAPAQPCAPAPRPSLLESAPVRRDQAQNLGAMASKAQARIQAPEAYLRLEGADPERAPEQVLAALRGCEAEVLLRRQRQIVARVAGDRLGALRAALEKAGRVRAELPPEPPAQVSVTISW